MSDSRVGGRVFYNPRNRPLNHWTAFRGCEPDCPACQVEQEMAEAAELEDAVDRDTEDWPLQDEMDALVAENADAVRQFITDHVRR